MKVINEDLLRSLHLPGKCGFCGVPCKELDPHHLLSRGFGGGCRLDVMIGILQLGQAFDCRCHSKAQRHEITVPELCDKIAARDGVKPDDILPVLYCLHAMPPRISAEQQSRFMRDFGLVGTALALCEKTLNEVNS